MDDSNDEQLVFDPRGVVEAERVALAPRVAALEGLRLGILDNTKWNGNRLLRKTAAQLGERVRLCRGQLLPQGELLEGRRPGADRRRSPRDNDIVLTAIGD